MWFLLLLLLIYGGRVLWVREWGRVVHAINVGTEGGGCAGAVRAGKRERCLIFCALVQNNAQSADGMVDRRFFFGRIAGCFFFCCVVARLAAVALKL